MKKINKSRFKKYMNKYITTNQIVKKLSQKEKDYIYDNSIKLIDLFIELEKKKLLKTNINKNLINEEIDKTSKNIEYINQFLKLLMTIAENFTYKQELKNEVEIILRDKAENNYKIDPIILAIYLGLTYASYCEFIKLLLNQLIEFKHNPTGIGHLIKQLKEKPEKITNLKFFDSIDSNLRNAFFHLNFEFKKEGILYYKDYKGNQIHKTLEELFKITLNLDRLALATIGVCIFYLLEI